MIWNEILRRSALPAGDSQAAAETGALITRLEEMEKEIERLRTENTCLRGYLCGIL